MCHVVPFSTTLFISVEWFFSGLLLLGGKSFLLGHDRFPNFLSRLTWLRHLQKRNDGLEERIHH